MATTKQISNSIFKDLNKWDIDKAIEFSTDESNTRESLIRPFFEIIQSK